MLEEMLDCFSNFACPAMERLCASEVVWNNAYCFIFVDFFWWILAYKVVVELSCFPLLSKGSGCRNARFLTTNTLFVSSRKRKIFCKTGTAWPCISSAPTSYLCSEKTISTKLDNDLCAATSIAKKSNMTQLDRIMFTRMTSGTWASSQGERKP